MLEHRLQILSNPWIPQTEAQSMYSVHVGQYEKVGQAFKAWADHQKMYTETTRDEEIHRYNFERFLQWRRLWPLKRAAVRWGMTTYSFRAVLQSLEKRHLLLGGGEFACFIRGDVVRDLTRTVPHFCGVREPGPGGYAGERLQMHKAIQKSLDITVEPVYCETSVSLGDSPPQLASGFDTITGRPVGNQHQVWLKLGKPISILPDVCSSKFYWENEDRLRLLTMTPQQRTIK